MLPQVMSAKQSVQQDRRARAKLRRGLKAKVTALEAETTDTGSASDESGHEVPQMDLLWPSQPLPPGELRRVQDCPERCSLSPGQVFRTSQGHLPVGRVDAEQTAPENNTAQPWLGRPSPRHKSSDELSEEKPWISRMQGVADSWSWHTAEGEAARDHLRRDGLVLASEEVFAAVS